MTANLNLTQGSAYKVATPVYEGPLDLLLQLIERAELDITKIALAQVTDQFLSYLNQLKEHTTEDISSFLVIAARLLQIKSEILLPRPPVREEGEEDPADALARQLIEYKRFKEIAGILTSRESQGLRTYLRLAPPPKIEERLDLGDYTLADLVTAAYEILSQPANEQLPSLNEVVTAPKITIRERIGHLSQILRQNSRINFHAVLGDSRSRLEVVVTFLAMLELIKRQLLNAHQDTLFGDIELERAELWDESTEFELEFGE